MGSEEARLLGQCSQVRSQALARVEQENIYFLSRFMRRK